MNDMVALALTNATIGQLAVAIQEKLAANTEVKIKPQWVRVQHIHHRDQLRSAQAIDAALR